MRQIIFAPMLGLALLSAAPPSALACSAMGENTHIGRIQSVDGDKGTLTIVDAETGKPITFELNSRLLAQVSAASGQVVVRYTGEGERLIATEIQ